VQPTKQGVKQAREFGRRVREHREELTPPMSQERLADKAGLHRTYIGHVERGEDNLTLWNIVRIAYALKVDPAELVRGMKP
jgi:transcriptional regulator with XRE-family HTH domain